MVTKKLNVCTNCLIKHRKGHCTFRNIHHCPTQPTDPKEFHNGLLCPISKSDSSVAALHFYDDADNIEDPTKNNALSLCEIVNLEPKELFECMPGNWEDDEEGDITSS